MLRLLPLLVAVAAGPSVPVVRTVDAALAEAPKAQLRVLHFWALWCGTCGRDLPNLQALAHGLDGLGIPLVGVSLDSPAKAGEVSAYARDHRLGFAQVVLDSPDPTPITERLDPSWNADLPATFIVSKSGKTLRAYLGLTPVEKVLADVRRLATEGERP